MKITLEVPDHKAAFVLELLQSLPFVTIKTVRGKAQPQDKPAALTKKPSHHETRP